MSKEIERAALAVSDNFDAGCNASLDDLEMLMAEGYVWSQVVTPNTETFGVDLEVGESIYEFTQSGLTFLSKLFEEKAK